MIYQGRRECFAEFTELGSLAAPVIVSYVLEMLPGAIAIAFAGHVVGDTGSDAHIAGASLSTMFSNVFGAVPGLGISMALDTLCSQAVGRGDGKAMGIDLQTTLAVVLAMTLPLAPVNWFCEKLLLAVGQDSANAAAAGAYNRVQFFGMPFLFIYEAIKKVLQAQGTVGPMIFAAVLGNVVVVAVGYILVIGPLKVLGLGYLGAAVARVAGLATMALALGLAVWGPSRRLRGSYGSFWSGWDVRAALSAARVREVLSLGLPGLLMLGFEWTAFEIMTLLAGLLSNPTVTVGAHATVLNTCTLTFMVYMGIGVSGGVIVGKRVGKGDAQGARRAAATSVFAVSIAAGAGGLLLIAMQDVIPSLFTSDGAVRRAAKQLIPIGAAFQLMDGLQAACGGTLRGIGKQTLGARLTFLAFYVVGLPLAAVLSLETPLHLQGLWLGITCGILVACGVGLYVLCTGDWKAWVGESLRREALKGAPAQESADEESVALAVNASPLALSALDEQAPFLAE